LIDSFYSGIVALTRTANGLVARAQTGQLRWYVMTVIGGVVLIVCLGVLL